MTEQIHKFKTVWKEHPTCTSRTVIRIVFFELPNKTGLKCPSARPYVRLSTKSFLDFNEIWYVGRGRRLMHDGMQY